MRRRSNLTHRSTVPLHVDVLSATSRFIESEMRARGCCKGRAVDELIEELLERRKTSDRLSTNFRQSIALQAE